MSLIQLNNIRREYRNGDSITVALNSINLEVNEGEFIAIVGSSGSGKSTLLNVIGCMDRATKGDYFFRGKDILKYSYKELANFRNTEIGFVFQAFNLVTDCSVLGNVEMPLGYAGESTKSRREKSLRQLEVVGLTEKAKAMPSHLSGGQQQRVAIARALVHDPSIILADEPTGNLDTKNSEQVMEIFQQINKTGKTIIMITHNPLLAELASRVVQIEDGILSESAKNN